MPPHLLLRDDGISVAAGESRNPFPPALPIERDDVGVELLRPHLRPEVRQPFGRVHPGGRNRVVFAAVGGQVATTAKQGNQNFFLKWTNVHLKSSGLRSCINQVLSTFWSQCGSKNVKKCDFFFYGNVVTLLTYVRTGRNRVAKFFFNFNIRLILTF